MRLEEKDKKLLIILGIIAIVLLPLFFVVRPLNEKIEATEAEIVTLEERLAYLEELYSKMHFFREGTQEFKENIADIIALFPEDIQQENTIMFLSETERIMPISLYQVAFQENTNIEIGTVQSDLSSVMETTQTLGQDFDGVSTQQTIAYRVPYAYYKEFINYIEQWEDRLTFSNMSAAYTLDTDEVVGSFVITQYAITGEGRELVEAETNVEHGTDNIFSANEEDWEELMDENENASMNQGMLDRDDTEKEEDRKDNNKNDKDKEDGKKPSKSDSDKNTSSSSGTHRVDKNNTSNSKGYDCYFMLNQPKSEAEAMIMGATNDALGKEVIKSDKNRSRLSRFYFYEENGKTYVLYKMSYSSRTYEITPGDDIVLNIYSSDRSGASDLVESSVAVYNETDKTVQVNVINDDEDRPRITFREKSGKIVIND